MTSIDVYYGDSTSVLERGLGSAMKVADSHYVWEALSPFYDNSKLTRLASVANACARKLDRK